jgi:hypothetical protein
MTSDRSGFVEEWGGLTRQWQSRAEPVMLPIDRLLRQERRRRVGMALLIGAEIAISAVALLGSWLVRARLGATGLAAVLGYVAMIWGFALWNRRGTWRPEQETVEGFMRLHRLRCERGILTTRFVLAIVAVQAAVSVGWIAVVFARAGGLLPGLLARLGIPLGVGAAYAIWAIWYRQVIRRRLERLEEGGEPGP